MSKTKVLLILSAIINIGLVFGLFYWKREEKNNGVSEISMPKNSNLVWFLGADFGAKNVWNTRGKAPDLALDPVDAQRLDSGNTLITDNSAHQVFEVTPDYKIVWSFGEYGVCGKDQNHLCAPTSGRYLDEEKSVLIGDGGNGRVILVDYKKRKITKILKKIGGKDLGLPVVTYNPFSKTLVIADAKNHYVAETDWSGKELASFGEWKENGSDETHLNSPRYAEISLDYPDLITIADYSNSRAIFYSKAKKGIDREFMVRWPRYFKQLPDGYVVLASDGDRAILTDYLGRVWWWWSYPSVFMERTNKQTFILSWTRDVYEVRWSFDRAVSLPYTHRHSQDIVLPVGGSAGPIYTGATTIDGSMVSFGFDYRQVTFSVTSDGKAAGEILEAVPRMNELYFDNWKPYKKFSINPNEVKKIAVTESLPVLGLKIINNDNKEIKVGFWISHE